MKSDIIRVMIMYAILESWKDNKISPCCDHVWQAIEPKGVQDIYLVNPWKIIMIYVISCKP